MSLTPFVQPRLQKLINNLAKDFAIDKISKSPARFSTEKLTWFNREFIKMMSLRGNILKCEQNLAGNNYRVGDYVYFVDVQKGKILINKSDSANGQDGQFYCIGGGRDVGESGQTSLVREVFEESGGKIKVDPAQLLLIQQVFINSPQKWTRDGIEYDGKEMNFWFCPMQMEQFPSFDLAEAEKWEGSTERNWLFDWYDLDQVIGSNTFVQYPIWNKFCNINKLPCFGDPKNNQSKYRAWTLDKNRASLLAEFDSESACILNYIQPETIDLKWKKITIQESVANLKSIQEFINLTYPKLEKNYSNLNSSNINDYPKLIADIASQWETLLKEWLQTYGFDTGSYLWPLRVGLSGKQKSPSPFELLAVLELEEVNKRIGLFS
jgi:glutamyl/glutaminyl-tRNA synthetase